jgi:nicotinamide riboside transporter PnuC
MNQPDITVNESVPRTFWHTAFLCCGITGSVLFNFIYFSFGAISPHYDMMRQPIGDLSHLQHGWIQSANCVVTGLFICVFAIGMRKELVSGVGSTIIPVFHVVTGLGLMLSGIFIYPPVHPLMSALTFISLIITFSLMARRFAGDSRWKGWAACTIFTIVLMLILVAVFINAQSRNATYAGVFERIIILARLFWSIFFISKMLGGTRLGPVLRAVEAGV